MSGDQDANAPLVIDPGAGTEPLTLPVVGGDLMFIQKMPVTKRVNRVTLGDLSRGSSCTSDSQVQLFVREHLPSTVEELKEAGGDQQTSSQIAYSSVPATLTATPAKVSFNIPATTLRKGRGYSFRIGLYSGCGQWRQTTWAHDRSVQVNAGPARCLNGPVRQRMWHVEGFDDRQPGCVNRPVGSSNFLPEMPTGWLASYSGSNADIFTGSRIMTAIPPPVPESCTTSQTSTSPAAFGAQNVHWRSVTLPDLRTREDYLCKWTQFAPLGDTVPHGWYYASTWRSERNGRPADMYLKLDTIDYGALLEQHRPILRYDSGEQFHILSPGALTDFDSGEEFQYQHNTIKDARDGTSESIFGIANDDLASLNGKARLDLGLLQSTYPTGGAYQSRRSGSPATPSDFVSARGTDNEGLYVGDAQTMEGKFGYPDKVYSRAAHGDDGKLWLQYWMFYYFNPDPAAPSGVVHEGDWELVQVGLNTSLAPDRAAYAQHNGGQDCPWASVEAVGSQPVVYVAEHSHASYFAPDRIPIQYFYDHADGNGGGVAWPEVPQITHSDPPWMAWPGQWGDSTASPHGPRFQGTKWSNPSGWASGC